MSKIYIYNDEGVSLDSMSSIKNAVLELISSHIHIEIKEINSSFLKDEEDWEIHCSLLIFPGGRDLPYLERLGIEGMERIKKFVKDGGKYLGICAGAYFGSDNIFFKHDDESFISGNRLSLAPYKAIGPINSNFQYNSERGAQRIEIKTDIGNIFSYYNGGPVFQVLQNGSCNHYLEWEEISRYSIMDEISSIGGRKCGKLHVLLLGTHFEFGKGGKEEFLFFSHLLNDLIFGDPILTSLKMVQRLKEYFPLISFIYFSKISSTQKYLYELEDDDDQVRLVLSDHQTDGHGRNGSGSFIPSKWESKWDNLQFSLSLNISNTKNIHMIQYLTCLAICESISSCQGKKDVRIKWPNDIYFEGKKVGGIIVQSKIKADLSNAVIIVGVGINLERDATSSTFGSLNKRAPYLSKEEVLKGFLEEFLFLMKRHEEGIPFPFKLYEKKWIHSQQKVFLENEQIFVTVSGLSNEGYLRVIGDKSGDHYLLEPDMNGGLSKGVIRRK